MAKKLMDGITLHTFGFPDEQPEEEVKIVERLTNTPLIMRLRGIAYKKINADESGWCYTFEGRKKKQFSIILDPEQFPELTMDARIEVEFKTDLALNDLVDRARQKDKKLSDYLPEPMTGGN